jgi:branched-chain amino acid transport system ATP-binding protein
MIEPKCEKKPPLLSLRGLTKSFGGRVVINNLDLHISEGESVGLMGPNGAGKTVLINLISGRYKPNSGKIMFKDCDITTKQSYQRCRLGIGRTFQIPMPYTDLTVMQNLMIPAMYGRSLTKTEAEKETVELLKLTDLYDSKDIFARNLSTIILKRLELARALAGKPSLLMLDEVVAGVTPEEMPRIMEILRETQKRGITILIIEHVIEVMVEMVDWIVVIDKGTKIAEGKPKDIVKNPVVIDTYLG